MDDFKAVLDDTHCHDLFAIVTTVHHEGADETFDDGALGLSKPLRIVTTSGMWKIDGATLFNCDVVTETNVFNFDALKGPSVEELYFTDGCHIAVRFCDVTAGTRRLLFGGRVLKMCVWLAKMDVDNARLLLWGMLCAATTTVHGSAQCMKQIQRSGGSNSHPTKDRLRVQSCHEMNAYNNTQCTSVQKDTWRCTKNRRVGRARMPT